MNSALQLKIDLSNKSYKVEEIPSNIIKLYLGGRGLGSHLLYRAVPREANPLGEENHLIFTTGPAGSSGFPYSSKANLNTKSPHTKKYLYSISSGTLAHEMRKAGFWAIDIEGIAESPTYILVSNQEVKFKDATHLWGMETAQAQSEMLRDLSIKKASTLSIGPAGEQLIKFAAVFSEGPLYRCWGRGGPGCVMGSKKLKGMVVIGDGKVEIPFKDLFQEAKREIAEKIRTDWKEWAELWRRYETAADLQGSNELGMIPTRNWQRGQFEGVQRISKSSTPMGWPEKSRACGPYCLTPGTRDAKVAKGHYKGAHSDIEWETIYAFGSECGVDKMDAIIAAGQICDEFGIDTITTGVTIGFAMECFEKGLIRLQDTNGIELRFGHDQAMIAMLKRIVNREGFGNELAKGTMRLAEEIKGSEAFAMHAKGLELGGYECRGLNGQALQFAINPVGGCHHAFGLPAVMEIADGTRLDIQGKGEQVKNSAINQILCDSLMVCTFPGRRLFSKELISKVVSALFGVTFSVDDLDKLGERVMCEERLFNVREGLTRKDDTLPERLLKEPKVDGPTKGAIVPLEELKDEFYASMGYDLSTGNPTKETLEKLGIQE